MSMAESGFKKMFVDEGLCFVGQSLINNQLNKVRLVVQKKKNNSNLTSGYNKILAFECDHGSSIW